MTIIGGWIESELHTSTFKMKYPSDSNRCSLIQCPWYSAGWRAAVGVFHVFPVFTDYSVKQQSESIHCFLASSYAVQRGTLPCYSKCNEVSDSLWAPRRDTSMLFIPTSRDDNTHTHTHILTPWHTHTHSLSFTIWITYSTAAAALGDLPCGFCALTCVKCVGT